MIRGNVGAAQPLRGLIFVNRHPYFKPLLNSVDNVVRTATIMPSELAQAAGIERKSQCTKKFGCTVWSVSPIW
jgi:hypothetical protein